MSFDFLFLVLLAILVGFRVIHAYGSSRSTLSISSDGSLAKSSYAASLRLRYLSVFLLAMFADWIQGAYVYVIYESHGYSETQIGYFFAIGFGSSMLFGSFLGGLADQFGRKLFCLFYCVFYAITCISINFSNPLILALGRVCGGLATSLLFSVFESWLICSAKEAEYGQLWLEDTFATATTWNGVVAIISGVLGNFFVAHYGFAAPFVVSLFLLALCAAAIAFQWNENYGEVRESPSLMSSLVAAWNDLKSSRVLLTGSSQALFEAAMYSFVFFLWPTLSSLDPHLSHGMAFACLMEGVMIGSDIFAIAVKRGVALESLATSIFGIAAASMLIAAASSDLAAVQIAFVVFEMAVGMFFPTIGMLRSRNVPEGTRATLMNAFRTPMNAMVLAVLLNAGRLSNSQAFFFCSFLLLLASGCSVSLRSLEGKGDGL